MGVSIPNSDATLTWQTHAAHKLRTSFTNDPEIVEFYQTGGTAGRINLTIIDKPIGAPPTVAWAVINYDASIGEFIAALNQFVEFWPYYINTGERFMYDMDGFETNDSSMAYTYIWRVSIWKPRPAWTAQKEFTPVYLDDYQGLQNFSTTQNVVHPHGPLIGGSFGISLGQFQLKVGGSTALSPHITASQLQSAIRSASTIFSKV